MPSIATTGHRTWAALSIVAVVLNAHAGSDVQPVLDLPDISQWERQEFKGITRYEIKTSGNRVYLHATSNGTASGLVRKISVDLAKTPYINWSWRVNQVFSGIDETHREGDDYPARIYIVISGGLFFWRTRAINYVWASQQPIGSVWPNAYAHQATMIAIRSGSTNTGSWVEEKRNVLEDVKRYIGEDVMRIDAVAIMTDTDNTGKSGSADYGNIYFSSY
ncbi:MAG TPA: DUF3047 domain-containing protein [Acidiferrobacteraceae bacterium]|nr:DUF3047 domain-containing protein [Acidiferrobacteraceae bacterium]